MNFTALSDRDLIEGLEEARLMDVEQYHRIVVDIPNLYAVACDSNPGVFYQYKCEPEGTSLTYAEYEGFSRLHTDFDY